jgi:SAM-dependent methyltransferase
MKKAAIVQTLTTSDGHEPRSKRPSFVSLLCPNCRGRISAPAFRGTHTVHCTECGFVIFADNDIWRALPPGRALHFRRFIRDYEKVRALEGRGSSSAEYYLALPFKDVTGRNSWQWKIRARTFLHLEQQVLPGIERAHPDGLDVLDIGAGNCWLSYRLALRGHRPVALDLLDNESDGLGAGEYYLADLPARFPRFQAEMDVLPFAEDQFDVAIFNASLHYSVDYRRTLTEVLRCLRRPGYLIIADSPHYLREQDGQQMVTEKPSGFEKKFGLNSDSIPAREYLTPAVLDYLAKELGLEWNVQRPWYGLDWAMRPIKARLLGRRRPSNFYVFWARVNE